MKRPARLERISPGSEMHREVGCLGKQQYPSESAAVAARKAFCKWGRSRPGGNLVAYRCGFCQQWHLGNE